MTQLEDFMLKALRDHQPFLSIVVNKVQKVISKVKI